MSKPIDHERRRAEIIQATWTLVARGGFQAATMREIAAEAGFANGALKTYFADKDELLAAAFQRTFFCINERAAHAIGDRTGLAAVHLLALEMLPLDDTRRTEARVMVAFWDRAAHRKPLMKVHTDSLAIWRKWMADQVELDRRAGRLGTSVRIADFVDEVLFLTTGMRALSALAPTLGANSFPIEQLERSIARLTGSAGTT
ncbi:TetR/AcrR family transcriptional regulator [Microbacterium sp. NPDC058389]|uniref:TetR/AcrR family transcriptional regulator n=1 Tax=Microbacterium sp. NPDC058389 TaxID=3346475 RepID=UPI0036539FD2